MRATPLHARLLILASLAFVSAPLAAQTLDVPIRLREVAGVARRGEAVTFGVPLPKGLVNDTQRLRLYGPDGRPVAASFRAVNRWWDDGSIQWIHTDLFADVAANEEAVYRLRLSDAPPPPPPSTLLVSEDRDRITVDTGPLEFEVRRLGPLLQAPGLRDVDFVLRSDERIYRAGRWQATTLEVEEQSPLKVVIKRTGAHGWLNRQERALDYELRVVAYAGLPYIRLIYTFVNRQGREMSDFVRLDELRLEGRLEQPAAAQRVDQLSAAPRRPGWFQAGLVGVGMRWFWQLYPKGFEIQQDQTLRLELFPATARPQNIYTGVAKTHEMLLAFDGNDYSAALNDPLQGVAPASWYTRDTGALGRLAESSPDVIRPEYWPLVQKYDRWLVESRNAVRAKRDRGFEFRGKRYDEYGMLNFGDAMHKLIPNDSRPEMPGYMRRAADWIFGNPREWDPAKRIFRNAPVHSVMLTPGLAYIAETSGDQKYWDVALESFSKQTAEADVTSRLKLFAQLFRNSQRFTWYLSKDFKPPGKARETTPPSGNENPQRGPPF